MITLQDPEQIELSNKAFHKWIDDAGHKLEELDQQHYDVLTNYCLSMDDSARDKQLHVLKWDLIELKIAMKATMHLWRQLRAEMD